MSSRAGYRDPVFKVFDGPRFHHQNHEAAMLETSPSYHHHPFSTIVAFAPATGGPNSVERQRTPYIVLRHIAEHTASLLTNESHKDFDLCT